MPGDVLEVEILKVKPKGWGWTGFFPKHSLLPEEFDHPYIKHWDLRNGVTTKLKEGVIIPIDPFCGTMGVAPKEKGSFHLLPPGNFGVTADSAKREERHDSSRRETSRSKARFPSTLGEVNSPAAKLVRGARSFHSWKPSGR